MDPKYSPQIDQLAAAARAAKQAVIDARRINSSPAELTHLAEAYADALRDWHRIRFPKRRFHRPSIGYLLRAL